jgi:hypothetical protein
MKLPRLPHLRPRDVDPEINTADPKRVFVPAHPVDSYPVIVDEVYLGYLIARRDRHLRDGDLRWATVLLTSYAEGQVSWSGIRDLLRKVGVRFVPRADATDNRAVGGR